MKSFQLVVDESREIDAVRLLRGTHRLTIERKGGKAFLKVEGRAPPAVTITKARILFPGSEMFEIDDGKKHSFEPALPGLLIGVMNCPNPACVSSQPKEPALPEIRVISTRPLKLRCEYCGRYVPPEAITPTLMEVTKYVTSGRKKTSKKH